MIKREIYSVVFNQWVDKEGIRRMYIYTLGLGSANEYRVPLKITKKDDLITILFNDGTRHIIHYNSDVEIFDREVTPKKKEDAKREDKADKKGI